MMQGGQAARLEDLSRREEQRRLSKEELLRPRITTREITIDGLGGDVVLKSLSHEQRQELRQKAGFNTPEWNEDLFTDLTIIASIAEPALGESDIAALRKQDASIYDEIVLQITMLNMMGRTEDLKKDSNKIPNLDSPSA